ncbi:HDOD domain-containing protein [Vibrio paucivorans]|uniref:HDOD domain-containing protein n=1 Tax=Vibrio paucivorans TaxID=2829489 RepID=A0A9X3HSD1_9VIBR|nr:HDOD domain-containing protein [Vibrio paucivorans]MCW8334723.1 HDOD domain-containing protein [Vibrio paucivorans]
MSQSTLISRLNELPRIESVLQELLDMVNQEEVNFVALANKISMDQVLSARLLRMANSAYFGGVRQVSSAHDAISRVGIGPVRALVVVSVLTSTFPNVKTLNLDEYWANTFEVSVLSSKLAGISGLDPNAVFTIGILHNIGELMIHTLVPNEVAKIEQLIEQGVDPIAAQEQVLDISAPSLGALLARSWQFPEEMVDAIEHFNEPREAELSPQIAVILHFARTINTHWDELPSTQQKSLYLAQHPDARLLNVPPSFVDTIEQFKGHGRDLAAHMMAA